MVFIPLVYNSGDQNVLINDWYACFQVLSKQLTVWNAYWGYNLVIALVFSFDPPTHWDRNLCYYHVRAWTVPYMFITEMRCFALYPDALDTVISSYST